MSRFCLGRLFRQGTFAIVAGMAATVAFAHEDGAAQPADAEVPAIQPDAEPARPDSIDAYQVRLADTEFLAGRLRVVDPMTGELRGVRKTNLLILQEGKIVGRAQTGVSGVAQIKSLPIGDYSVVAIGPDGMAAFGFEVLPMASGVAIPSYRFDTLIVPGRDVSVGQRAICAAGEPVPAPAAANPAPPAPLPPIPVTLRRQVEGPVRSAPVEGIDAFAENPVAAPLKGQPMFIQQGETGVGQIVVLSDASGTPVGLTNARLSFIRSGQLLGIVETDDQGYCGVVGLDGGIYSMVGVGSNGFIALGVQVQTAEAPSTAKSAADDENFVNALQVGPAAVGWRVCGAHASALVYAPGFGCGAFGQPGCCGQCSINPCHPCAGGFGGFGGGGFAGGGGGFGGGGLLGALVGAGVGAGIGAAIADDDDAGGGGNVIVVSPNAPPTP